MGALRRAGVRDGDEIRVGDVALHDRPRPRGEAAVTTGVLGSLCNPPHLGHLLLASEAAWQLGLDRVLIVPTGVPSHREAPPETPQVRLRLAEAFVTCDPVLELCRIEVDREGPSYTADTLEELAGGRLRRPGAAARSRPAGGARPLARARARARGGADRRGAAARARRSAATPTSCGCPRSASRRPRSAAGSGAGEPIRHLVPDPVRGDHRRRAAVPLRRRGSLR